MLHCRSGLYVFIRQGRLLQKSTLHIAPLSQRFRLELHFTSVIYRKLRIQVCFRSVALYFIVMPFALIFCTQRLITSNNLWCDELQFLLVSRRVPCLRRYVGWKAQNVRVMHFQQIHSYFQLPRHQAFHNSHCNYKVHHECCISNSCYFVFPVILDHVFRSL